MKLFSKYIKRYFILDIEASTLSYAQEKGKWPTCIIMLRVSTPTTIQPN
jgi:hypothetical protein